MKTIVRSAFLGVLAGLLMGGCATIERQGSGCISAAIKLNRRVVLYAANGDTIKVWEGRMMLEDEGGGTSFMLDGKRVVVSGTYTVEEL
jgi:hypothetical protein